MPLNIRQAFHYPLKAPSWYIGHMVKSLREMAILLKNIDLVIEARDARLPLTSINGAFDAMLEKVWGPRLESGYRTRGIGLEREKLVVYTKRDLAEERFEKPLIKAFRKHMNQKAVFVNTHNDKEVKSILQYAIRSAKAKSEVLSEMNILVVGMPNVGKSSLLNSLRRVGVKKGKAFRTGDQAGVTRKVYGTVKINEEPPIYVYDAPGVMVPFLGHGDIGSERGLKYALTAGMKQSLVDDEVVTDYLLWRMNRRYEQELSLPEAERSPTYIDSLGLQSLLPEMTDDIETLLDAVSTRQNFGRKGQGKDYDQAMTYLIHTFRMGKLGKWTLDNLEGVSKYDAMGPVPFGMANHPRLELKERAHLSAIYLNTPTQTDTDINEENAAEKPKGALIHEDEDSSSTAAMQSVGSIDDPLDESVSAAVQEYLETTAARQAEVAEGKGLSTHQKQRAEFEKKLKARTARMNARMSGRPPPKSSGGGARRKVNKRKSKR